MYICALVTHLLLRALSLAFWGGFSILDSSLLVDTLFLVTIMTVMLYGAYVYERNDRIVFLRMQKSGIHPQEYGAP